MNILNVQDLRKSYGPRTIFDGVSFAIDDGEKVGFIGANGSGKSTLFRIAAGVEGCESGVLALRRGARVGYLAQEPALEPGQTILGAAAEGHPELQEALAAYREVTRRLAEGTPELERLLHRQAELAAQLDRLGGWEWEHRVEAMLTRVGLADRDRPVDDLSGGERKRVALARALLAQPDLLLLDEPTNHLDADTVLWLEEHLADYPGAVLLITHDRYFLDRVVDRMIEVTTGELVPYAGGYTEYLEEKATRLERQAVEEEKRLKLIEKELEWARRAPPARTGKARARVKRRGALEAEQRRYHETGRRRDAKMEAAEAPRLGRTVLELRGITKSYGGRTLIRGFGTSLRAGQRIGIIGPNGAGKTTLLRLILGEEAPDAGEVALGQNTKIAYFDQERSELDDEKSIYETVAGTDWVSVAGRKVHLRSYLEDFLFPTSLQQQKVRSLSGGERNRLALAKLLLQESNLLILDEPTNDLDLVTLQILESVLEDYPGCVLVVTHDRFFLDKVATDLWVFEGEGGREREGMVREHAGDYDLYRKLREEREAEKAAARQESEKKRAPKAPPSRPPSPTPTPVKLTWKEQRELEGLEERILIVEAERDELAARLADPALYSDAGADVAAIAAAFHEAEARVEALYARWAELEERAAAAAAG